jgi:hypothetical protein
MFLSEAKPSKMSDNDIITGDGKSEVVPVLT